MTVDRSRSSATRPRATGAKRQQQPPGGTQIPLAAQETQETEYGFQPGQFYLLDSNAVIKADQSQFSGAHSDIQHPEVVWPVVDASR